MVRLALAEATVLQVATFSERNRRERKRKASTVHVRCHRRSGMLLLAPISRGPCGSRRENLFDRKGRGTYFGSEAIHKTVR